MAHVFTGLSGSGMLHGNGAQAHVQQQQHPHQPFDIDMLISDPNATTSDDSEQQHAPSKCRLSDAGTTSAAAAAPGGRWQPDGCAMADWQTQQHQHAQHPWQLTGTAAPSGQPGELDAAAAAGAAAGAVQDPGALPLPNQASKDSSTTVAVPCGAAAAGAPVARSSDDSTAAQQQQQVLQQVTLQVTGAVDGAAVAAAAAGAGPSGADPTQQPQQLQFTAVNVSGAPTPDLQQPGLTIQSIQPMIIADAAMLQQILQQQQQQQQNGGGAEGADGKAGVLTNLPGLSLPAVYDEQALQQLLQQVVATAPDTDAAIWQQQQPGMAAAGSAAAAGAVSSPTAAGGKDNHLKLLHLVPLAKQLQPALPAIAPVGGDSSPTTAQQQAGNAADPTAVANAAAAEATAAADAAVAAAATAPNAAAAAALAGNMLSAGPSGMQVFVASPAGKPGTGVLVPASLLSPGVFTPGANKEELKGCCEALMMLSKPGEDGSGTPVGAQGVIAMMPNKPGVGAAAAMAAVRSTAAMVAEAPAAAALTIPGGRGGKVGMADLMPRHAGMGHHSAAGAAQQGAHQHSHAVAVKQEGPAPQQQSVRAAAAAATAGGEPQLGRGKRVRKPQQWSQQMQLLDQLVDSVEHSAGSSGDFHAHPGQAAAAAAVGGGAAAGDGGPAAKRQRRAGPGLQQGSGPGFEDDEADESYDAAADANGDEEEAAELAEYEEELMQQDQGEGEPAGAAAGAARRRSAGKRGGGRGRYMPRKLKDTKAIFERAGGSAAADVDMPAPLSHSWGSCSYLGVSKKRSGKWQAAVRFGHDGSYAFWCCYGCPKQAARARDAAALALRGPAAARLNFPEDTYSDAEVLAAAAHILQKHPHLHPLEHPLLKAMSLADILGGGAGDALGASAAAPAAAAAAADAAAADAAGDGSRGVPAAAVGGSGGRRGTPPLDGPSSAAAAASAGGYGGGTGGKSRGGPRQKQSAAAAERAQQQQRHQHQQHYQEQQQQQQDDVLAAAAAAAAGENGGGQAIDTATMFSRLFDLAALVVFGPCAATETPASAFYPEELAAAAAAMSCRMPPGGLASVQEHLQSLAQAQQEQQRLQQQGLGTGLEGIPQQELEVGGLAAAQDEVPAVVKQMQSP